MEFPLSVHHCCIFNLFDAHLALAQLISLYKAYVMKPFEILPPPHHGKMVKEARAWSKHAWDKCNHHSTYKVKLSARSFRPCHVMGGKDVPA